MESFAAVVRTLLVRIRALQAGRSGSQPPSASNVAADPEASRYRVAPTTWGVEGTGKEPRPAGRQPPASTSAASDPAADRSTPLYGGSRRPLQLRAHRLPTPRGLPVT